MQRNYRHSPSQRISYPTKHQHMLPSQRLPQALIELYRKGHHGQNLPTYAPVKATPEDRTRMQQTHRDVSGFLEGLNEAQKRTRESSLPTEGSVSGRIDISTTK